MRIGGLAHIAGRYRRTGINLHSQRVYTWRVKLIGFFRLLRVRKGIIMNTKKMFYRMLVAVLSIALCMQAPAAQAEIVSTGEMAAQHQVAAERADVQAFLERASVMNRVQAMGVNGIVAKERVAALSDDEVHALAQRIDSLPAGGASMSDSDWIVVGIIVVVVIIIIAASHSGSGMGGGY
jgi:hypothetical protein